MIDRDIKWLKKTTSKNHLLAFYAFYSFGIVSMLVIAAINFRSCHYLANSQGLTVLGVFAKWLHGISPSEFYSGRLLIAISTLANALMQIGLAIVFGVFFFTQRSVLRRNIRILNCIEGRDV
ncbi:MAG: hypothetical protein ACLQVJ_25365 [Syntrophobacteraceae bacterium]